jgi:glucosamine-6-phosphate deaminase
MLYRSRAVPAGPVNGSLLKQPAAERAVSSGGGNPMRPISRVAPDWWDYTTLDPEILADAARLSAEDFPGLAREGFDIRFYDTLEDFYLAEALEYIVAWRKATADNPAGICGPIGPTEQLPLVARIVNELELDLRHAHFWGMDEWAIDGREVGEDFPLSFARADKQLCFDRIAPRLRMPEANLHFPTARPASYSQSYDSIRCLVMQGGQGEVKHWAFNDPPRRTGKYVDAPPTPAEYRRLATRVVDLHPMTIIQNAGAGHQRGTGRNLEGRQGVDLARRQSRQSIRPAADDMDDFQANRRRGGADVAVGRSSARAIQFFPRRHRLLR